MTYIKELVADDQAEVLLKLPKSMHNKRVRVVVMTESKSSRISSAVGIWKDRFDENTSSASIGEEIRNAAWGR